MPLRVEELILDDWAIEELWRHGIRPSQVGQVQQNPHILLRNRRNRRATHRMVGVDEGGRLLTICIAALDRRRTRWEVVTGWESTAGERTLYESR